MARSSAWVVIVVALLLSACVHRSAAPPAPQARQMSSESFVDLQPGWKVRVVVPILKSGGYVVPSVKKAEPGTLEIKLDDDFVGYERAYYKVEPRANGGVQIRFTHAEVWQNRKSHKQYKTRLPLFDHIANARRVRLVYLTRYSQTDHSMAIVAADDEVALKDITTAVTERGQCEAVQNGSCTWVPEGVAVTPDLGRKFD